MFEWRDVTGHVARRASEASGAIDGMLITGQAGLVGGTRVASNLGWRAVDALCVGDSVLTFDHGMQRIADIQRETLWMQDGGLRPLVIPHGAMYNRAEILLMPDQGLLVESDAAIDALGDPFAVIPARALEGFRGVRKAGPAERLDVTTLSFVLDEVIYVEGGMLAHCPRPRRIMMDADDEADVLYDVLDADAARSLVECLIDEDNLAGFTCDPDELDAMTARRVRTRIPSLM